MAKFELRKTDSGHFNFSLKNKDGKTLLKSEQYNSKLAALNGIDSVRTNAVEDKHFALETSHAGQPYFNVKAGNGQIVGTSVMYASVADRDAAIAETKATVKSAGVVEDV
ncbi:YegP family protein [Stenoxybacter acetivorans]|uniref:YegP family protein n=1 Tax=Stenoxybacter acetivorans TaxID=422441 RepID=UPI00056D84C7|nr:YegP family protein [Stenoxybacter acetivorans]